MVAHGEAVRRGAPRITDRIPHDRTPLAAGASSTGALGDVALAPEYAAHLSAEDRRIIRLCLGVLATLGAASMAGVAFSLYLIEAAPLLLIALSPLARHFVLVAPSVDPVAYLAIGITRRMLFFTACFYLGRSLGPVGLVWLEARARRFAGGVRWLERLFRRGGHVVVLLMAGPMTSTLAGIAGMRIAPFLLLASLSLFYRLVLVYLFADVFREPIEAFLAWLEEYQLPGTIALITGIVIWRGGRRWFARRR